MQMSGMKTKRFLTKQWCNISSANIGLPKHVWHPTRALLEEYSNNEEEQYFNTNTNTKQADNRLGTRVKIGKERFSYNFEEVSSEDIGRLTNLRNEVSKECI